MSVREPGDASPNPYEYRVEEYRALPNGTAAYRESGKIKLSMRTARGLAVDAQDGIWVAGDRHLDHYLRDGTPQPRIDLEDEPQCVVLGSDGQLFVGMTDHVEVLAVDGVGITSWPSLGENALITSVAVTADSVFVADFGGKLIWRFDLDGRLLGQIGAEDEPEGGPVFVLPSPGFDLAAAPDGSVWVTNPGRLRVEHYAAGGERLGMWGEASMRLVGFCGCCNPTNLAITTNGALLTSEKGLARIKVYDDIGQLLGLAAGPDAFDEGSMGLDLAVDSQGRVIVLDPVRRKVRVFVKDAPTGALEATIDQK